MNIKLLKKVKKRFGWYIRQKPDSFDDKTDVFILVDHKYQRVYIIDVDFCRTYHKVNSEFTPEIGWVTMKFRTMKEIMVNAFIKYNYIKRINYNLAKRYSSKFNKRRINGM